jgi:hypothetical protein
MDLILQTLTIGEPQKTSGHKAFQTLHFTFSSVQDLIIKTYVAQITKYDVCI